MKKSVLDKIFLIVLGGSFIGAIFVAVLVFFLTSEFSKSLIALIGSQILFLIPVFGIRKIIDDTIIKKLSVVSQAMQEVSMGNLDYEIKVEKTGDELEELAESFERMRISLKTIMEKLEKGEL
ncbi:MAG TPA: HAMP domain-containing protein [Sulfurihydrogenibium sp.]|uniref:HAMP domain-containing protein n=1 Tax=Sulfurihydrogenibium sp. (strain YO3AOP1) TaxID=436114 RepID=UPI0001724DE6|nr:HAMP domain-containing protein [Sulfurihydrogenibium sp. YO3AOP1]ACD65724.1 putative sensor with HAMP domain [Sulfurihydrogenibium sp. YO3AOP1]HBT97962.1 HAMP domain-containing protein [Sulfurihydrogenibium sp.]